MGNQEGMYRLGATRCVLALLAFGAVVALVAESIWSWRVGGRSSMETDERIDDLSYPFFGFGLDDMLSVVIGEEESAEEPVVAPTLFIDECFDPQDMGEVNVSEDGGVVGIVSEKPAGELFQLCADRLDAHGWIQVQSGQTHRCTFLKEQGEIQWLFLDVMQVADSGVAVVVTQGGA